MLVALVESYRGAPLADRVHAKPSIPSVLHYAIDELGHTQAELAELLGSRSRASEVLARKRALNVR